MKKIFAALILGIIMIPQLAMAQNIPQLKVMEPKTGMEGVSLVGEEKTGAYDPSSYPSVLGGADAPAPSITAPTAPAPSSGTSQSIDNLFKRENLYTGETKDNPNPNNLIKKLEKSKNESTFSDIYSGIAKLALGVATIAIFVGLVVAGVLLVTGQGEEGATTKAKQILMYILVGVIILAASYAIVTGISRINPL